MQEIRVLGSALAPEFRADVAEAELVNLAPGAGGLDVQTPGERAEISWTFASAGGARGLYLRYACPDERPCKLFLNGEPVQRFAAFEPVLERGDWRYQATVQTRPGENRLTLRPRDLAPNIMGLAVAEPPAAALAAVDDYYAMLREERLEGGRKLPLTVKPAKLAGLVEVVRGVVGDDRAFDLLLKVVERAQQAARTDALDGQARMSWGGPLNGQRFRQQIFQRLMRLGVDAIVETGTFLGTSTAHFARQGVPVFSCETSDKYFGAALAHLAEHANVTLYLEDSRAFLRHLAADPGFGFGLPLFYLDAHWGEDLPLAEEIRIIRERWPAYVIMVDDFQAPGTDYLYDKYPNGKELSLDYLVREGVNLEDFAVLFPTASEASETGARRGTLVLTPPDLYAKSMTRERALYRHLHAGASGRARS